MASSRRRDSATVLSRSADLDKSSSSFKSTSKSAMLADSPAGTRNSGPEPPSSALGSPQMRQKTTTSSSKEGRRKDGVSRVRVAVRLRPKNAEEMAVDTDFSDCVELQPEMKRVNLRKNNWENSSFQFDEVLTETSSQKRVYEVVAKPVVESVCDGYNGTVMAYGQSGTGKTFTLGHLGEENMADRGIMVRALEDILSNVAASTDDSVVTVSYLQLYKETVQDLLAPEKDNLSIVEDPKTGDISIPSARQVELKDQNCFLRLLQTGEANRFAANTKLNTDSSRSHAILFVNLRKVMKSTNVDDNGLGSQQIAKGMPAVNSVRKSKLLIVDLAGSERIDKSGSDGNILEEAKAINLSLTALGKCINALAENSPHVPIRDSKLTRILRDSFGGTARTSLIITIGPSSRNRGETASTIAFGQRALKVENVLKLKEEFDYRSRCRQLQTEADKHMAENERQCKAEQELREDFDRKLEEAKKATAAAEDKLATIELKDEKLFKELREEFDRKLEEAKKATAAAEDKLATIELKDEKLFKEYAQIIDKFKIAEKKHKAIVQSYQHDIEERKLHEVRQNEEIAETNDKLVKEQAERERLERKLRENSQFLFEKESPHKSPLEFRELETKLENEIQLRLKLEEEVRSFNLTGNLNLSELMNHGEEPDNEKDSILILKEGLEEERRHRMALEKELTSLKQHVGVLNDYGAESRKFVNPESRSAASEGSQRGPSIHILATEKSSGRSRRLSTHNPHLGRDTVGKKVTTAKLYEQVGLLKTMSLLESEDVDVCVYNVKMVAQLASETANQEKIVQAGGLGSLLRLLQAYQDETVRCAAAQAVANLSTNESIQELIMGQGGIPLLAQAADDAEDPRTLRMVAGAIANLCANDKLHLQLREEGGMRALVRMVRSSHPDVLAGVARGISNFAKCESRGTAQGCRSTRRSFLVDDGALPWIVANVNSSESSSIKRHLEVALSHLAQSEANSYDLIAGRAHSELVRISKECTQESIRIFVQRILNSNDTFQREMKRSRHAASTVEDL